MVLFCCSGTGAESRSLMLLLTTILWHHFITHGWEKWPTGRFYTQRSSPLSPTASLHLVDTWLWTSDWSFIFNTAHLSIHQSGVLTELTGRDMAGAMAKLLPPQHASSCAYRTTTHQFTVLFEARLGSSGSLVDAGLFLCFQNPLNSGVNYNDSYSGVWECPFSSEP